MSQHIEDAIRDISIPDDDVYKLIMGSIDDIPEQVNQSPVDEEKEMLRLDSLGRLTMKYRPKVFERIMQETLAVHGAGKVD